MINSRKLAQKNLSFIINSCELTQKDIYSLFWIDDVQLKNILAGNDIPSMNEARLIAEFLGVSVYDFFHSDISQSQN